MQVCPAGDFVFQDKNAAGYHAHTDVRIYTYIHILVILYLFTHTY
jgi:hypothetical protein